MEQSGSQHLHNAKPIRSRQQSPLPSSQGKTLRLVDGIEEGDRKHGLDPRDGGAEVGGTTNPFRANFSTTDHLICVDRSEIIKPRVSDAQSLMHDNLCKLQTVLADPSPWHAGSQNRERSPHGTM